MKLVEDCKGVWRHFSTRGLLVLAALPGAWELLPPDIKASLPTSARDWIQILIAFWALGGKFIEQKPRPPRAPRKPRSTP